MISVPLFVNELNMPETDAPNAPAPHAVYTVGVVLHVVAVCTVAWSHRQLVDDATCCVVAPACNNECEPRTAAASSHTSAVYTVGVAWQAAAVYTVAVAWSHGQLVDDVTCCVVAPACNNECEQRTAAASSLCSPARSSAAAGSAEPSK